MIMKKTNLSKKIKLGIISLAIAGGSVVSFSFTDSYFEISKNLDIFASLFRELNIYYVDETNPGDLMKTGIDAMLNKLDPFTNYIPESDIEDYRFMTTGQYGGIGSLIRQKGDYVVIAEPYEDFPAHKAGLMAGDKILEVNGKSVKGKTTSEMSKILKGQAGTSVELLIQREGEDKTMKKTLLREEIKIKDVPFFGVVDEGIGYIKLTSFTETASKEVKEALLELKEKQNIKSLILDLRGNGGGLLREAVEIVNLFVEKGNDVVFTRGKLKEWDRTHKALNSPVDLNMPLVVLLDRGSASASEIVSGALQDYDRAVLIGRKTYGKGLVQQTRNLSYNAKLKVTVAKYYIPSGRCIQKLDYSHRNKDGTVSAIADSLIKAFKTKNGRLVYDGAGITPDIKVKEHKYGQITATLVNKNHVFDYATAFRLKKAEISPAKQFSLSESEYNEFTQYLNGKDYSYVTQSENLLKELEKTAEKEKYFQEMKNEFEALRSKLENNKKEDLKKFKPEIKQIMENEIVSRYYYQKGRIVYSLNTDPDVKKAIEVLSDSTLYSSVLKGLYKDPELSAEEEEDELKMIQEEEEGEETGE
jgi:carboxyl-terminal processing protease